jgi:DNA-binding CsgD family transcriptional regulator
VADIPRKTCRCHRVDIDCNLLHDKKRAGANFFSQIRADPAWWRQYAEYYSQLDPWATGGFRLGLTTGDVASGEQLCPGDSLKQTEFCNDFLRQADVFHQTCGVVLDEERGSSIITCLRPKRLGPFGEEQIKLLRLLMPHLRRALQLHERIVGLENKLSSVAEALNRVPVGFVLVDATGKILMLNRSAQGILNLNDGLVLGRDGLVAHRSGESNRLRGLIKGAIATGSGKGTDSGGIMTVSRPSLRRPFQILVTPLRSRTAAFWPESAAAAIFVSDPESRIEPPDQLLGRLFGLTPAEGRLAGALMQGSSLKEAAGEFRLSHNTVRSQLRSIFDKTATTRQGELVRLLWNSPVQLRCD